MATKPPPRRPHRPAPPKPPRQGNTLPKPGLRLPHELDESADQMARAPDRVIVQAQRDLAAGLVDTDMRATPGLDAERRAGMVPGAGGQAPRLQTNHKPDAAVDSKADRQPRKNFPAAPAPERSTLSRRAAKPSAAADSKRRQKGSGSTER